MTHAIVDVSNFYVSSERVFDPKLRRVPVIVLSNNDGCAIARSEEAKALHIKMGDPLFKIRDIIKRHGIEVRSSNYELYADMNRRFNAVIAEHSDLIEIYSIDESFYRLPVLANGLGDVAAAHKLRAAILRQTGLPTRIGLGPTRALSKVANALAKATEKIWDGVVDLHDTELRARLFAEWPIKEVWGIGSALAARLHPLGIRTTADLVAMPPASARDVGTVVLERLVRELNGIECDEFKPEPEVPILSWLEWSAAERRPRQNRRRRASLTPAPPDRHDGRASTTEPFRRCWGRGGRHTGQSPSGFALSRKLDGLRCQDSAGQFVAVDLAGDVASIELLDLFGKDAALVADVPACEVDLAATACALGFADLTDPFDGHDVILRVGRTCPDGCASGQSASSFVDTHDSQDARGLEGVGRILRAGGQVEIEVVDFPVAGGLFELEPAHVALGVRVDGVIEPIVVAHGTDQLGAFAEATKEADVPDQVADSARHHDVVVAWGGDMIAEPVVEPRDLGRPALGLLGCGGLVGHVGLLV